MWKSHQYISSSLEDKIRIPARPCNILYIHRLGPASGSLEFATEDGWVLIIRNMFCKFKTVFVSRSYFLFATSSKI